MHLQSGFKSGSHRTRVLLLEDEDMMREALSELLVDRGYEVVGVRNGARGLRALEGGFQPDIILLDLLMPVMDGWTFHSRLKERKDWEQVPLIVISAVPVDDPMRTSLPAVACFPKPFHLRLLLEVIENCCSASPREQVRYPLLPAHEAGPEAASY